MIEVAIAASTFLSVVSVGGGAMAVARQRRQNREARNRALADSSAIADGSVAQQELVACVYRLGAAVSSGTYSRELTRNLARAGYHSRSAPAIFLGAKVLALAVVGTAAGLLALGSAQPMAVRFGIVLAAAGTASFLPNLVVAGRRRRRERETQRFLPDAVDLLEICVSSGMALDQAWGSVAEEIRRVSPTLSDEMELTNLEIRLGVPRHEAMRNMSHRTGAEEISSLVALMVQSERFGASIVTALQTFAASMREASSKKAEEAAERMAVKMIAPMVLFIFPTLLIVMVGPAVMRIADTMT